jgi:porin
VQAAVYQTNPRENADPTNGLRLSLSGGTGVLIPVELGWAPTLWKDRPGIFKIGGWYETSPTNDNFYDRNGNPIVLSHLPGQTLRGRHGEYFELRQQITPSPKGVGKKGLSVFVNLFKFDHRTSTVDDYISAGFVQTGTFKGRSNDQVAIEFSRTHVNSKLAEADRLLEERDPLLGVRGSEYAVELDYRIIPTRGLRISPNIQYVANPSGYSNHHNVLAFGIMTNLLL